MKKTLEERLREIKTIYKKLDYLGMTNDYDAIIEWKKLAQHFIKTGESSEGTILFPETGKKIHYRFCNRVKTITFFELKK